MLIFPSHEFWFSPILFVYLSFFYLINKYILACSQSIYISGTNIVTMTFFFATLLAPLIKKRGSCTLC